MAILRFRSCVRHEALRYFNKMSSSEVRQSFFDYFERRDHVHFPSSSVLPLDDPTLLFVNAGMNQFKSIFLGTAEPDSKLGRLRRVFNCQKCIRAGGKSNDLGIIGQDNIHHSFFEMLGNWSFGDYYKNEACSFAWEFLIDTLRIPPDRLYVTYFGGDESLQLKPDLECRDIWRNIGVLESHILPFGSNYNFWDMGDIGPCGACSEIHYDMSGQSDAQSFVNQAGSPVIEIWNLVFLEYNRDVSGKITRLPKRHIDCGMGFERICTVMQGVQSNYDTDIFSPLIDAIAKFSKVGPYCRDRVASTNKRDIAFRIIADHLRACCVGFADGVILGSTGRGFVLRQMLRRAALVSENTLHSGNTMLQDVVPYFIEHMGESFPEILRFSERINSIIRAEESRYWTLVARGRTLVEEYTSSQSLLKVFPGKVASHFWFSHGVPLDITEMIVAKKNMIVDVAEFERCCNENLKKSHFDQKARAAKQPLFEDVLAVIDSSDLPATDDSPKYDYEKSGEGYVFPMVVGEVLSLVNENIQPVKQLQPGENGCVLLSKTCFYAEEGGQACDTGVLQNNIGETVFTVDHVIKRRGLVLLLGTSANEILRTKDVIQQRIDGGRRISLMKNHTATHLLLHALREFCGLNVCQKGSSVLPECLRLSCSLSKPLSLKQVSDIQSYVNKLIDDGKPVIVQNLTLFDITKLQNLQTSLESYLMKSNSRTKHRVISIGDPVQSDAAKAVECCCGTHVLNTSEIGGFQIISRKMTGAGICRFEAVTGSRAFEAVTNASVLSARIASLSSNSFASEISCIKDEMSMKVIPWLSKENLRHALKKACKALKKVN